MRRPLNPHEARLVATILEDPRYDEDFDAYEMASDIVRAINERRERESLWVVAAQAEGRPAIMVGPYTTIAAAQRGRDEARTGFGSTEVKVGIWRIRPSLEEAEDVTTHE